MTAELTLTNLRRTIASSIMAKGNSQKPANGSALDFEAQLWAAAEQAVPAPNYPPFNMSDWSRGGGMRQDVRWKFGMPPVNNANYAWIKHFMHQLAAD
jgi:hypothetical protein